MVDIIGFRNDQSGVSPVIGVILMVAVTVIIAAVIGSSALGLTDEIGETPPNANWEFETLDRPMYDSSSLSEEKPGAKTAVEIIHEGGESVSKENIEIRYNGDSNVYAMGPEYHKDPDDKRDDWEESRQPIHPFETSGPSNTDFDTETIEAGDRTVLVVQSEYIGETRGIDDPYNFDEIRYVLIDGVSDSSEYIEVGGDGFQRWGFDDVNRIESGGTVEIVYTSGSSSQLLAEYTVQ